jgi:hypothetical protein
VYGMYLNCTEGNVSPTFKGIAIDWEPWWWRSCWCWVLLVSGFVRSHGEVGGEI